ncbi:hypothetical protein BCR44DRAFT_50384 [Catenaria anguillulae PL171]|uniref:RNA-binding S4 domain-containing protein n=1 Tax=Catenaria anguillulae PL171 TaxID=765915 RepID=A0A1Y2HBJ1_9FUNG|nr:hypothetical protein BCR44DRAFT_50384 [Catenaria anguillulae PL171]
MKARPGRFNASRGLIRMSWSKYNLYNLATRQRYPDLSRRTLFQQMWQAKKEARAYHGGNVTERQFYKTWNSEPLPVFGNTAASDPAMAGIEQRKLPPMQTLTFSPLERRVDVAVFRACFMPSVYAARQAVSHGKVMVNGQVCKQPSYLLRDGDMFSILPSAIPMLSNPTKSSPPAESDASAAAQGETSDADAPSADTAAPSTTPSVPKKQSVVEAARGLKFTPRPFQQPWMFIPEYLEVNFNTCSGVFVRAPMVKPGKSEVPSPFPPEVHGLAHEYYSRR